MWQLYNGDCIEVMKNNIKDKSIDMILTDLPYAVTGLKWDTIIPFDDLWQQYKRIIKDNGAIVLTACQPFTTKLIASNYKLYRYNWVWEKNISSNFQLCKKQPMKNYEDICVFYKRLPVYNPQGLIKFDKPIIQSNANKSGRLGHLASESKRKEYKQEYTNYPKSILKYNCEKGLHPTQKPVGLFEYLIKTYTNEGMTVLDSTAGSGTTGVAAELCNRNSIMIEQDAKYCELIRQRMKDISKT